MVRTVLASSIALTIAAAASATSGNVYCGAGGSLVDFGTAPGVATFTINVTDAGVVGTFNGLTLTNFTHTWAGDLVATLTLPDATVVSLFDRIGKTNATTGFGDSSDFNGNYVIADGGANLWAAAFAAPGAGAIPGGSYYATGSGVGSTTATGPAALNLNALLAGKSITGTWTLTITDFAGGDTGALGEWCLDIGVVPAPGAMALLGLAGLAGRRRRA
jgi:MYXO-CTERM domain-containing protein